MKPMQADGCPMCGAHGLETPSEEGPEARYVELDTGCTDPLCGILCRDCREVGVMSDWEVEEEEEEVVDTKDEDGWDPMSADEAAGIVDLHETDAGAGADWEASEPVHPMVRAELARRGIRLIVG